MNNKQKKGINGLKWLFFVQEPVNPGEGEGKRSPGNAKPLFNNNRQVSSDPRKSYLIYNRKLANPKTTRTTKWMKE